MADRSNATAADDAQDLPSSQPHWYSLISGGPPCHLHRPNSAQRTRTHPPAEVLAQRVAQLRGLSERLATRSQNDFKEFAVAE
jgi:hypothetical protein